MGLQTAVEVVGAQAGVDDSDHNQDDGDDGKEGHRRSSGQVFEVSQRGVHPEQLEAEISHRGEQEELVRSLEAKLTLLAFSTYNDNDHANHGFSAHKPGATDQNENGHGDGSHSKRKFDIHAGRGDQDEELHRKAQEEKEIEFQESDIDLFCDRLVVLRMGEVEQNTNLIGEVATLHLQIGTDMLVDCPCELVVEFIGHESDQ